MRITRGGTPLNAVHIRDAPLDRIEPLTTSLWQSMLDMQAYRAQAVGYWQRYITLAAKVDKTPGHPRTMKAEARLELLKYHIRETQWKFLILEEDADLRWRQLSPTQRREQGVADMFGIEADADSILGMWPRKLGEQKGTSFPIDPILFRFITPAHAKAYKGRTSWRNPDNEYDPDSVSRKRRTGRNTSPEAATPSG